jgi:hypothetical protein
VAVAQQPDEDFTHCDSTGNRRYVAVAQQTQPDDDFTHCDSTGTRRCVATLAQYETPKESYAAKAATLKEHLDTIASATAFEAKHNAAHSAAMDKAAASSKAAFDKSHDELKNNLEYD